MNPFVGLALAAGLIAGDDKIDLRHRPAVGDRIDKISRSVMDLTILGGGQSLTTKITTTRRVTEDTLEAANGERTKVRRQYVENVREQTVPGNAVQRIEDPLQGKTLTLTLRKGKTEVEGADDVDPSVTGALSLSAGYQKLLPKAPVAVGDRWTYEGVDALEGIGGDDAKGTAEMTLKSIETVDGERCARIAVKLKASGKNEKGMAIVVDIAGEMLVTVARGLPVSFDGSGTMKLEGQMNGRPVHLEGPVTFQQSAKLSTTPASAPAKKA
jgi:hypothetical protein